MTPPALGLVSAARSESKEGMVWAGCERGGTRDGKERARKERGEVKSLPTHPFKFVLRLE